MIELEIRSAEEEWFNLWKNGSTHLRLNKIPLQVGVLAPDIEWKDSTVTPVNLRDFWEDSPVLFLFRRHYGCSCGIDRAKCLQNEYSDYINLGVNVVHIGQS